MRRHLTLALGGLLFMSGRQVGWAQATSHQPPTVFQQLFPVPTRENGYEELVQAGEMAHGSARLAVACQPGASLKTLRDALADPLILQALRLLRSGIARPVLATRHNMDENTLFPELPLFRDLGRALKIEQYVLLADGRNAAALGSMRDGLKLAQVVQSNFALSGLVGLSIDSLAIESITLHLEAFSIPDCNHLLQLLEAWLAQPSPLARMLQGEREFDITILRNKRTDSAALLNLLKNMRISAQNPPSNPLEVEHLTTLVQSVEANPQTVTFAVDQAATMVDNVYEEVFHTLREPTWTWKDPQRPDQTSFAGQLASSVILPIGSIMEKYVIDRAKVQLLAVCAAIHRFQWEYNRLPTSLEELRIGDLAIDPFTGKSMRYMRKAADSYELSSAGGLDRSTTDTPLTDQRKPITLPGKAL
jgi:hypothetical protein